MVGLNFYYSHTFPTDSNAAKSDSFKLHTDKRSHCNKPLRDLQNCIFLKQSTVILCACVCVFEEARAHHSSFDKCFYL